MTTADFSFNDGSAALVGTLPKVEKTTSVVDNKKTIWRVNGNVEGVSDRPTYQFFEMALKYLAIYKVKAAEESARAEQEIELAKLLYERLGHGGGPTLRSMESPNSYALTWWKTVAAEVLAIATKAVGD